MLLPLLTAVLIFVELTRRRRNIELKIFKQNFTFIIDPFRHDMNIMFVESQEVGVVDKFLWVRPFSTVIRIQNIQFTSLDLFYLEITTMP